MHLAIISLICCLGMFVTDALGTLLTKSIAAGRAAIAGITDPIVDFFSRAVLTSYGFTNLTHAGLAGWLWLTPVLLTGGLTTFHFTKRFQRMRSVQPEPKDP